MIKYNERLFYEIWNNKLRKYATIQSNSFFLKHSLIITFLKLIISIAFLLVPKDNLKKNICKKTERLISIMSPISINCHELDELSRLENSWRKYFPGGTSLSLPFKEDQSPSITDRSKRMGHRIDTYTPLPPPCIWKGKQLSSMNRSPISEAEEYTRYRAYQPIPPPLLCRDRFEARR